MKCFLIYIFLEVGFNNIWFLNFFKISIMLLGIKLTYWISSFFTFFLFSALTDVRVWVLDRRIFQAIMMKTGLQRQEENIKFLRRYLTLKGCTYYRYLSILHMSVYLVTYGCVTNIGVKFSSIIVVHKKYNFFFFSSNLRLKK
jgi:hypothetical protein